MTISNNYNTGKRRTLEEIMKTPTEKLSPEEKKLLIDLPSMSHEQLEARFTPDEIEWIERSHKIRKAFSRMPSQNQLKIFNSVTDHLTSVAESFAPFVNELAHRYEAQNGRKLPVMEQEAVLLRCVLSWHAHAARGEKMTDDLLRDIAAEAYGEQVGDKEKKSSRKITRIDWSTAAVARAAAEKPSLWDGDYHQVTVNNRSRKVQTIQIVPINGSGNVEFLRNLDKETILGLQLISNISGSMVSRGYNEFTAGQLAEYAQGGYRNHGLAEWFAELLDIGITTSATIWEAVRVDSKGKPIDDPSQLVRRDITGVVLPFYRGREITRSYEYTKYTTIAPGALPIFYKAGQEKKQLLEFRPEWVHIESASLTGDRLFAVYYVLEHFMLARKDYLSTRNKIANRNRRGRGKAISQEEASKMAAQSAREKAEMDALMNLRFDTLFEKLSIDDVRAQQRMKNFLIDSVLPQWVQDDSMPLVDFTVNKVKKNRTGVKLLLNEQKNGERKK